MKLKVVPIVEDVIMIMVNCAEVSVSCVLY